MAAGSDERIGGPGDPGRLASLDGLRGLAALAVVLFHVCIPLGLIAAPNGYLAVDFFFLLSGYVLAHVYEARLRAGRIGPWAFMRRRLARLYPLVAIGVLMGVGVTAARYAPMIRGQRAMEFFGTAAANLLVLPLGRLSFAGDHPLFAANAPIWSLFWELAANAVYGAAAPFLGPKSLAAVIAVSALALAASAVAYGSLQAGAEAGSFAAGPARVGFSFFAGVALRRLPPWRPLQRLGAAPLLAAGLLALVMLAPMLIDSRLLDPLAVVVLFPAILMLALQREPAGGLRRLALAAGDLSYPVYVTHFPIMQLFLAFVAPAKPAGLLLALIIAGELGAILAVALVVLLFYDRPVRAWLRRRARPPVRPDERAAVSAAP